MLFIHISIKIIKSSKMFQSLKKSLEHANPHKYWIFSNLYQSAIFGLEQPQPLILLTFFENVPMFQTFSETFIYFSKSTEK